jgi:hypothetical protein
MRAVCASVGGAQVGDHGLRVARARPAVGEDEARRADPGQSGDQAAEDQRHDARAATAGGRRRPLFDPRGGLFGTCCRSGLGRLGVFRSGGHCFRLRFGGGRFFRRSLCGRGFRRDILARDRFRRGLGRRLLDHRGLIAGEGRRMTRPFLGFGVGRGGFSQTTTASSMVCGS